LGGASEGEPVKPVQARIPSTGSGAWLASRSGGARLHAGVDLLGPVGTPVVAPEAGTVVLVYSAATPTQPRRSAPPGWSGYGPKGLLLRGNSGACHNLAHMGAVEIGEGSVVTEGARLGTIGATETPHLHWEVRAQSGPTSGAAIVEVCADPGAWVAGRWEPWDGRCPVAPEDTPRTPRACRPGWRGPAPRPFPRPLPRLIQARCYEVNPRELVRGGSYGS
jgi:murein DD-endopeptidase MepM/ murein hydrolase activator NlpD